jgi:excisionase family DNA binding protein
VRRRSFRLGVKHIAHCRVLKETAAGRAVTLVPLEPEITTQQAAELLNVLRPHVVSLIETGTLPARMVGNHRGLPLQDVLACNVNSPIKCSYPLTKALINIRSNLISMTRLI